MKSYNINLESIKHAYATTSAYIDKTPLMHSNLINKTLGSNIYFKMEMFQKTGAFKIRGIIYHLLQLKQQGRLPEKIVGYSSGNHGLAMAYAARLFNIDARIYLASDVSMTKKSITEYYGAEVIIVGTRKDAMEYSNKDIEKGYYYIHPSDNADIITGAGTVCYEAIIDMQEINQVPDAIFAPCGGGGLLSGTYLARNLASPKSEVHGVEPESANDAYRSVQQGSVYEFQKSPPTIADGLRALSVSEPILSYLQELDNFHLVEEREIIYWNSIITQTMKVLCEPSAAVALAGASNWLKTQTSHKTILIILTGGNVTKEFYQELCDNHVDLI